MIQTFYVVCSKLFHVVQLLGFSWFSNLIEIMLGCFELCRIVYVILRQQKPSGCVRPLWFVKNCSGNFTSFALLQDVMDSFGLFL